MAKPPATARVTAEFATPEALVAAVAAARNDARAGLRAYVPQPVPALVELLGDRQAPLERIAATTVLVAGGICFLVITWATLWGYRFNIGGRPPFSWPYYVIPCVSAGLLTAALVCFGSLLALTGLPRLSHPAFDIANFERASHDRYVLSLQTSGSFPSAEATEAYLRRLPTPPLVIRRLPT